MVVLLVGNKSQAQPYSFKRLNVKDGLSQSAVLDITKDRQGLMWFATRYGLNRYDGVRFKIYENQADDSTSISNNYINALYRDSRDRLWIGSQGGLDLYDEKNDNFRHFYFFENFRKVHGISVLKIREDHRGNIWVGTNRGLFLLKKESRKCIKLSSTPGVLRSEIIHEIYVDNKNILWATSAHGITRLEYKNERLSILASPSAIGNIKGHVRSIIEDDKHNLWFGSETNGLYGFSTKTNTLRHFGSNGKQGLLHPSIRELMITTDKKLFIATQNGVSIMDLADFSFTNAQNDPENPNSLSQNSIYALFEDDQHSLWIGTYFGGVNLAYGINTKFERLTINSPTKIPHNVIRPIAEDRNHNLWFGTEGGGVFLTDRNLKKITGFYNHNLGLLQSRSNFVKSILIDHADSVWIGTSGGGLYHLNPNTGRYSLAIIHKSKDSLRNANIMSLYQDSQGRYWVFGEGYNKILIREGMNFRDVTPKNIKNTFSKQMTVKIVESIDDQLWILTSTDLFKFNPKNGEIKRFLTKIERPIHAYNCMLEDHKGRIWIGVDYEGLMLIDPKSDSLLRRYTSKDGLTSDNIVGLLEDRNKSLWITTTRGLSRLTNEGKRIQNYSYQDGLADDEFNYNSTYLSSNGTVFLGSLGGITWFNPSSIEVNDEQPSVIFTGLNLFGNQPVSPTKTPKILPLNITNRPHLNFNNSERVFTIQFALSNYIKAKQNRFMYRLEGQNAPWSTLDKAEVSFSNLAPGTYILAVKGSNSDGIWSKQSKITFTIEPPAYLSWWALLIYVSILCLLLFFIVRYLFLREILIKEEQLHQTKLNFFSMISHEIRSHLSLIIIPIDNALEQVDDQYIRSQLTNASKNSKRLLRLSSELIDFRKVETTVLPLSCSKKDIAIFINDILESFRLVYQEQGLTIDYTADFSSCMIDFDSLQLEKVFFNLLSNAVKYGTHGAVIQVESKIENEHLVFSLTNQGKEIPSEYLEKIFENFFQVDFSDREVGFGMGLALSKQIMRMHSGEIYAASKAGKTTFTIVLPIKQSESGALPLIYDQSSDIITLQEKPVELKSSGISDTATEKPVILIIEDNADLRSLLCELLSNSYQILTANNGVDGVLTAQKHLPNLIISDVMMPMKNGMEVCSELKTNMATSHIPIILLTAKTKEKDILEGLNHHADVYLTKPYNKHILHLHIQNLIRTRYLLQQKYRQEYIIEPTKKVVDNVDEQFLSRLVRVIEEGIESSQYGVDFLASEVGMSSSVLYKKVKSLTGMTVNEFSKSIRLKKAAQMLSESNNSVNHVAGYVGFMDSKYFSREFKKQFGMSPSHYPKVNAV